MISIENYCEENLELKNEAKEIFQREKTKSLNFLYKDFPQSQIEFIEKKAKEVQEHSDLFIIIGVGGSNGASRAVIEGLNLNKVDVEYAGNGLSPRQMERLLKLIDEREVSINVIAQNFKTLEPGLHFRMLREKLKEKYGEGSYKRIFVTGTKDSLLHEIAIENNYTFFEFDKEVGGRFSAFTNVHLFPIAVAGGNIRQYLNARDAFLKEDSNIEKVLEYVSYRQDNFRKGKLIEILSSMDLDLTYFNKWWVQLFGESEGVDNTGIYPDSMCFSEDLHSMGQFIQVGNPIFMETFLRVKNYDDVEVLESKIFDDFDYLNGKTFSQINKAMEEATIKAHKDGGTPVFDIVLEEFSEESFGNLFTFFLASVIVSSYLGGVSPFGQSGVEAYKEAMNNNLRGN